MKTLPYVAVVAMVVFSGSMAFGAISGSAHDFSGDAWMPVTPGTTWKEICRPCHVPHNAYPYNAPVGVPVAGQVPLWNHRNSIAVGWQMYWSPTGTMNATVPAAPGGVSLACLSCHDGVTAIDAFGGGVGTTTMGAVPANLGTDLRNDHPISFVYNSALATADGGLYNPATQTSGLGGTIEQDMLFGTAGSKTLECASCHDVHNTYGQPYMLLKSNNASALCLTCHNK